MPTVSQRLGIQSLVLTIIRISLISQQMKQKNGMLPCNISAGMPGEMVVKEYDRVLHLFSSFGYFSDKENEQVPL